MGLRGPVTDEQRVDLLKIQRSKNHLDGLVSDVLNFAKLGSGKIDFRVRPISVRQTVDAVIEMVAPQLVQKALRLESYAAPNDGHILADADRTRQILLNAVSYTHLRAHETPEHLVCRLLLEKKK